MVECSIFETITSNSAYFFSSSATFFWSSASSEEKSNTLVLASKVSGSGMRVHVKCCQQFMYPCIPPPHFFGSPSRTSSFMIFSLHLLQVARLDLLHTADTVAIKVGNGQRIGIAVTCTVPLSCTRDHRHQPAPSCLRHHR